MEPPQRHCAEEQLAERPKIRAITKTPRGDGAELAARREEQDREREEGRVEIAGLDAHTPKREPRRGVRAQFLVRWVQDCVCEEGAETAAGKDGSGSGEEVALVDLSVEAAL